MKLVEWLMTVVRLIVPQRVLDMEILFLKSAEIEGTVTYMSYNVGYCIEMIATFVIGICIVYFLVWVPFRAILHLLNWKRWRGY